MPGAKDSDACYLPRCTHSLFVPVICGPLPLKYELSFRQTVVLNLCQGMVYIFTHAFSDWSFGAVLQYIFQVPWNAVVGVLNEVVLYKVQEKHVSTL